MAQTGETRAGQNRVVRDAGETERQILIKIGSAFADAERLAPGLIQCRAGCDECCKRQPFSITQADAERLREGMRQLALRDPGAATQIRLRAADYASRIQQDFPGDWNTGAITDNSEWREWFYQQHRGLACPVLDPTTGACLLHEHRPVCCRLYGPLIRVNGAETSGPCHLNYVGLTPDEIEARGVNLELPALTEPAESETMIVFAVR